MTYTLLANSLNALANGVKVTAWGSTANNANAKTLRIYFESLVRTVTLTASINGSWRLEMVLFRVSVSSQQGQVNITETVLGAALAAPKMTQDTELAMAETLSGNITIKMTGQATTTNDILQMGMLVEYFD